MSRPPRPLTLLPTALGAGNFAFVFVFVFVFFAMGTRARPSFADTPNAPSSQTPSAAPVIVLLAPDLELSDVDDRAVGTLGARVRANGIKVVVVRRAMAELRAIAADSKALIATWGARGALWIDVGRPDEAALYLVTRDGEQVFGRSIPAPEGKTSATLETLANIAASVSEELLEGRIVELSPVKVPDPEPPSQRTASPATPSLSAEREPAPAPKPSAKAEVASPPPPAPTLRAAPPDSIPSPPPASGDDNEPEPRFPRLGLSVGYTGDTFGATIPWQNAVSALVTVSPSPNTFLGLGYDYVIPVHVRGDIGGYGVARHPIVATGGVRQLFSRWDLGLSARFALDILRQTFDQPLDHPEPPPGSEPFPQRPPPLPEGRTEYLFTAGPVIEAGYSFAGRFRAGAFVGLELLLNQPGRTFPPFDLEADPARVITGLSLRVDLLVPPAGPRRTTAAAPTAAPSLR